MSRRIALYARYSDEHQIRGISLQAQLARLRTEAQAAGETIVGVYIDQARSGTKAANRKEFQDLLAAARRGEFAAIRIESVDRGHRNDGERRAFESEMEQLGVRVIYCGEPDKQAPDQRKFQRGLRGLLAELEADTISQRVYDRQLQRATKGKWRGGPWPYGLQPDGAGWFIPDPTSYPVLVWIFERRAEGLSYHAIAKQLNQGIALDDAPARCPDTPGMLTYRRKPYLERQDPETGDIVQLERAAPSNAWSATAIQRLCGEAIDGVYAGVLVWGRRANRFSEDRYGNAKQAVRVAAHPPLVAEALLLRVRAIEAGIRLGTTAAMTSRHTYVLDLYCGDCGHKMHGYSPTSYKPSGKTYKYRQYRCGGRSNRPGSCTMTSISSRKLEAIVVETVVAYLAAQIPGPLTGAVAGAIERYRAELAQALITLDHLLAEARQQRDATLDAIVGATSAIVQQALTQRVEEQAAQLEALTQQRETVQLGIVVLDDRARAVASVVQGLEVPQEGWEEPRVRTALRQALHLIVDRAELQRIARERFCVKLRLCTLEGMVRSCQISTSGSRCESNTPTAFVTPPANFEDWGGHQTPSAPIGPVHCTADPPGRADESPAGTRRR